MRRNMSLEKNKMPSQEPEVRKKNFLEVATGYTEEQAVDEAKRCLDCKHKPCIAGCPVRIEIPEFIQKVIDRDFEEAYQIITNRALCQQYVVESVHRKHNVKKNV